MDGACLDWIAHRDLTRAEIHGLLLGTLAGALVAALASGFLDLSVASSAPPPEPKKEVVVPPAPPPVPQPDPNHVYSVDDAEVTAPVPVRQDVPRIPPAIARQARDRGVLDLVIDERGRVVAINVRVSVHPMYDTLLMTSARDWKYQPATLGGKPVKFRKLIQINVTKPE